MNRSFVPTALAAIVLVCGASLASRTAGASAPATSFVSASGVPYASQADCESFEGKGNCKQCPQGAGDPGWHRTKVCGSISALPANSVAALALVKEMNSAEGINLASRANAKKECASNRSTWLQHQDQWGCLTPETGDNAPLEKRYRNKREKCEDKGGTWLKVPEPVGGYGCYLPPKK